MLEATNDPARAMIDALRRVPRSSNGARRRRGSRHREMRLRFADHRQARGPPPRARRHAIDFGSRPPAEALIEDIFKRQPKLEAELVALARGF
jgi:electron transfer flavoprotein beta subunit